MMSTWNLALTIDLRFSHFWNRALLHTQPDDVGLRIMRIFMLALTNGWERDTPSLGISAMQDAGF